MRSFASDNNSGVHPLVMEALNRANIEWSILARFKASITNGCTPELLSEAKLLIVSYILIRGAK